MIGPGAAVRRCLGEPRVQVGGALMIVLLLAAVFAPILAPHDPGDQDLLRTLAPPPCTSDGGWRYPLGTDRLRRDVLSRLLFGALVPMRVPLFSALRPASLRPAPPL